MRFYITVKTLKSGFTFTDATRHFDDDSAFIEEYKEYFAGCREIVKAHAFAVDSDTGEVTHLFTYEPPVEAYKIVREFRDDHTLISDVSVVRADTCLSSYHFISSHVKSSELYEKRGGEWRFVERLEAGKNA